MSSFFHRRRARKQLRMMVKHARHIRDIREDIADPEVLHRLKESELRAREAIRTGDCESMNKAAGRLEKNILSMTPGTAFQGVRDNIEMLVVAVAVAMAFRTYFVQPFKIPTSSMAPTLQGITFEQRAAPGLFDRFPMQFVKWAVLGQWYVDVRARASGTVDFRESRGDRLIMVRDVPHLIHKGMHLHVGPGDRVIAGQRLASGARTAGDHILVNKVIWNFRRPRRGEIMVFKTDDIEHPEIKQNEHYVKRLVGLPGETINIVEPYIKIDGKRLSEPESIRRVENARDGYVGFRRTGTQLGRLPDGIQLGPDEFYSCGDNQASSLDSRYWGPVPRKNLVGPAFLIYWPFSRRWGFVD